MSVGLVGMHEREEQAVKNFSRGNVARKVK